MKYQIALVGRANVGKSTLFNKVAGAKTALVSSLPGTTRDRLEVQCQWQDTNFSLVDTGGFDVDKNNFIDQQILLQTKMALEKSSLILFLVDARAGILPGDIEFAKYLRTLRQPIMVVMNKADRLEQRAQIVEFYRLGFGTPIPVSATNGSGVGDLLDEIVNNLKKLKSKNKTTKVISPHEQIKIAFLGQPNVGKSSLINSLLNEQRVIVSPEPHTTRGVQVIPFSYEKIHWLLLDTAGLRRRNQKKELIEKFSVDQLKGVLKEINLALLIIDIKKELTVQDKKIADLIAEHKLSCVIVANKWDLVPNKDDKTINKYRTYVYRNLPLLSYAPIIFVSALEKQRVHKILDLAGTVYQERFRQITDNAMDKFLKWAIKKNLPPKAKGTRPPRLLSFSQVRTNPPTFILKIDSLTSLANSYLRFLVKTLHQKFGFQGTPINIRLEAIDTKHSSKKKKAL
ncbi:MAG: ribosome biogenesis GTPase Der [Candidatus Komeilibacteria bacterium CG_4_10_14_0_2_um_filter_37_10]|uniref:GTPase Der n=1 Tax=Candidatus Komeilibacteria bacterium CG_4_10_14_0_2_um_filter_37_10 TaxID=1974470 RepID=A0A2M7VDG2_9BACT|nr:MAG: ribosome biogenesis GTPase Der [Candidatus Komeilibacteria bacterium CG_4_10_14_0_2_um_filter_37_10]